MFSNNVRGAYGALLGPAHTAMSSAMACRVYRTVLLFTNDEDSILRTQQINHALRDATTAEEYQLSPLAKDVSRCGSEETYSPERALRSNLTKSLDV